MEADGRIGGPPRTGFVKKYELWGRLNLITQHFQKGFIMKKHDLLLMVILIFAGTLPMLGQDPSGAAGQTGTQTQQMSVPKPTFETTVVGVHMKVWVMTQAEHKQMMEMQSSEKHDDPDAMGADKSMAADTSKMDPMMSGTHHIKLELSDDASGKKITTGTASVQIMSPSMKNATMDLTLKTDHFGGGLTLDEKGMYQFILTVVVDGVPKTAQFNYTVI
jgi:hypothetical protein